MKGTMMNVIRIGAVAAVLAVSSPAVAEQTPPTPEQRETAAREKYEKGLAMVRPIGAVDSVWIEELTYLEVRDALKAGKTTALILAGSTEQNGPYLPGAKHQHALRQTGESIARKLGNALVAPIVPIEAGNPRTGTSSGAVSISRPRPSRRFFVTSPRVSRAKGSSTSL